MPIMKNSFKSYIYTFPIIISISVIIGYLILKNETTYWDEFWLIISLIILLISTLVLRSKFSLPFKRLSAQLTDEAVMQQHKKLSGLEFSTFQPVQQTVNTLIDKINNAADFVKKIENNELDAEYKILEGETNTNDSLSQSLISMRRQMLKIEEENRERNWATQGTAQFVEILRNNDKELKHLAYEIISTLVSYLGANQGGIFILNDEDKENPVLELISAYAFNRKKHLQKTIEPGQGLVGQAFLEKETIYITEVPEDYIHITSGLGDAPPRSIIIVPLKINETIFGMLEMASFKEFKPYQIEFLEKLGESIASSISGKKTNEKTRSLLEESQQQAEEMRAQEEEMRQNMEELESTQEEMRRVGSQLELEQEKLNVALRIAKMANWEFNYLQKTFNVNENFLNLFKTTSSITGGTELTYNYVIQKFLTDQVKLSTLFEEVADKNDPDFEGKEVFELPLDNRQTLYIKLVVRAELDDNKNVKNLYGVVQDITQERLLELETKDQMETMQAQDEEMRQNMEELQAMHEQQEELQKDLQNKVELLEEAKAEMEKVKEIEKKRADEQIAKRNKLMEKSMLRFQEKEEAYKSEIEELKSKLK